MDPPSISEVDRDIGYFRVKELSERVQGHIRAGQI